EGPGGRDDQPGDGVNSQLMIQVEDAAKYGVGPELAQRGVWFYVFYPLMRAFDTILFNCNGHVIEHSVSVEEAAQTSHQNPLPILVDNAALVAAGEGTAVPFSYTVKDWIGNGPAPEPYSVNIPLWVNLKGNWFDKPVLSPQHGPDTIDLGELNGQPVIAKVHIRTPWATGDTLELTCTYRNADDKDVTLVVTREVKVVPHFPELSLNNSYFADASGWQIWVYYKQLRNGRELGRSYSTPVMVTGNAQVELKAPFLVAPAKNPIDSSLYPEGVTVRVEHLTAQEGDEARLEALNALPGTPEFATVKLNQNKRANFTLSPKLLKAHRGRNLRLRWVLIRKGSLTRSPELRLRISAPVETLTFDNDPYTLAPAGRFTVSLALAKNGVDLPGETVELSLPKDFTFSDNVGGSRRFVTDKDGKITVNGVKGHTVPGAYSLTALHENQTVTGVATVRPQESEGIITGIPYPYNIAISPDGTRAYIVGTSHSPNYGALTVVDTATHQVIGSIALGGNVCGVAVSPDNSRVYITRGGAGSLNHLLTVVDTTNLDIIANVPFHGLTPFGIAISPDGSRAYVCSMVYPFTSFPNDRLAVVDTARFETLHTIVLQKYALEVAVSPDGSRVYAANANGTGGSSGTVSVIDTSTFGVVSNIEVGSNPHGIVVSRDGTRIYTVRTEGSLLVVIDARTHAVIHNIPIGIGAWHLALSPDGKSLCASEWNNGKAIVIVDTTTFSVRRIPVGRDPRGVAFSSDSTRVYICNFTDNNVLVVGN
ncbi:YncE family protein, partial [Pseudomonas sp. GL-B-26]|uniref:YncE family protein n=1 Tax=Pseudomonas sp. GL-B-26 TaxID=2832394 RepID=UPI001CBF7331